MKTSHIIFILIIAAVVAVVLYSLSGGQSNEEYASVLNKEREEKDLFMKNGEGSPFANDSTFSGLNYFPPDLKYRINAKLIPVEKKKIVKLGTSDGLEQKYQEYAVAQFALDGKENKLLLLEIIDSGPYRGQLFLAFADGTSANETYGAGRYLDVKKTPGSQSILLDFNESYNPYCAYSETYSCPLPPRENILEVEIKAGEKSYRQ